MEFKTFSSLFLCNLSLIFIYVHTCSVDGSRDVEKIFDQIKSDPTLLRIFVEKLPKGGDLHNHITGSGYAENLLKYAQLLVTTHYIKQMRILKGSSTYRKITMFLQTKPSLTNCENIISENLGPEVYRQLLSNWSLYEFRKSAPDSALTVPSDIFFKSFKKYEAITNVCRGELLAENLNRAALQHVSHVETIILVTSKELDSIANKLHDDSSIMEMKKEAELLGIEEVVFQLRTNFENVVKQKDSILKCSNPPDASPGCHISFGFIASALRVVPIKHAFVQIMATFILQHIYPTVLGINFVGPEHDSIALKDYNEHMKIFQFFKSYYPKTKISLHAGELRQGLVTPEELRNGRIQKAITIGGASRIGHGVAIGFEPNITDLINAMRNKPVAVEICLTSNALLLGVHGKNHPFDFYRKLRIPVTLNTDDQAVLRTDINKEFLRGIMVHNLSFADVRAIIRNSVAYSFLPGKNLWDHNSDGYQMFAVHRCQHIFGKRKRKQLSDTAMAKCEKFLKKNLKAQIQAELEMKLEVFESLINNII